MPNRKIFRAVMKRRYAMLPQARRVYRHYTDRVPELIGKLDEPNQRVHDVAYDLLAKMGYLIVPQLLVALEDPSLNKEALDDVVTLLGLAGDEKAVSQLWAFFHKVSNEPARASTVALSLSNLGDGRVLPFLRVELESDLPGRVANAVAGMIMLGELEDVDRLRTVHRRFRYNREIRFGVANAILTILDEISPYTLERVLEQIRTRFADRALWEDIWGLLENSFGTST